MVSALRTSPRSSAGRLVIAVLDRSEQIFKDGNIRKMNVVSWFSSVSQYNDALPALIRIGCGGARYPKEYAMCIETSCESWGSSLNLNVVEQRLSFVFSGKVGDSHQYMIEFCSCLGCHSFVSETNFTCTRTLSRDSHASTTPLVTSGPDLTLFQPNPVLKSHNPACLTSTLNTNNRRLA